MCLHHIRSLRFHPAGQFQPESDLSIVHPVKTTAEGSFISHSVSHRFKGGRFRRDLQPSGLEEQVYYKVNYKGRSLTFNLTVNHHLVSSGYILERRNGGTNRTERPLSEGNSCHLLGSVESSDGRGTAAVSTCRGLVRGQESYALKSRKLGSFPFIHHLESSLPCRGGGHIYESVFPLTGGICFNTPQMKTSILGPVRLRVCVHFKNDCCLLLRLSFSFIHAHISACAPQHPAPLVREF